VVVGAHEQHRLAIEVRKYLDEVHNQNLCRMVRPYRSGVAHARWL